MGIRTLRGGGTVIGTAAELQTHGLPVDTLAIEVDGSGIPNGVLKLGRRGVAYADLIALPGGGSGSLSIADPQGVTTEDIPNTVTGDGTMTCLVFPQDTAFLAIKIDGDANPRWLFTADGMDGLYLGDGTIDPFADGPEIAYAGPGYGLGISGGTGNPAYAAHGDGYYDHQGTGPVVLSPNGTKYRIIVADDGALTTEVAIVG